MNDFKEHFFVISWVRLEILEEQGRDFLTEKYLFTLSTRRKSLNLSSNQIETQFFFD